MNKPLANTGERTDCLIRNVDWKNNPTRIIYKISEESESLTKTALEISEFKVDKHKFIKSKVKLNRSSELAGSLEHTREVKFKEEVLLLRSLSEGSANLYYFEEGNLRRFFYSKKDNEPMQLVYKRFRNSDYSIGENNQYKQQLWNNLKCEAITKENVNKVPYKIDALIKLFESFNNCADPNWIKPDKKKSAFIFKVSIRPGLNSSSLDVSANNTVFDNKKSFRIGTELEVIMPFNKGKWSFTIEPTYRDYQMNIGSSPFLSGQSDRLKVDYTSVEISIGARHSFYLTNNSKLFMSGYLLNDLSLNSTVNAPGVLEVKPFSNFAIGLGYKIKDKISMEFRYDLSRELFRSNFITSEFKNISVIFGYTIL